MRLDHRSVQDISLNDADELSTEDPNEAGEAFEDEDELVSADGKEIT